jgi:hypothetical protein
MKTTMHNKNATRRLALILTAALGVALVSAAGLAAPPEDRPGRPAKTAVYDYRDYGGLGSVTQRVYTDVTAVGVTITEDLSYDPITGLLDVQRTVSGDDFWTVFRFQPTDTDFLWLGTDRYAEDPQDPLGDPVLISSVTFDPPLSQRQSAMPQGATQVTAALRTFDDTQGGLSYRGTTFTNVAVSVEDLELPYGTLTGCLKVHVVADGNPRTDWYCPGVGRAKRVFSGGAIWELTGCTGCTQP